MKDRAKTPAKARRPSRVAARDIVGTWKLVAWEAVRPDGRVSHPLGPAPQGLTIYGADGWMSAAMCAGGREPLSTGRARSAPDAERARAFDSFLAYSCRWRVIDDAVLHEVVVALNPGMVGTRQLRRVALSGRSMVVRTEDQLADGVRRHRLVLRRVAPTAASRRASGAAAPADTKRRATAEPRGAPKRRGTANGRSGE